MERIETFFSPAGCKLRKQRFCNVYLQQFDINSINIIIYALKVQNKKLKIHTEIMNKDSKNTEFKLLDNLGVQ